MVSLTHKSCCSFSFGISRVDCLFFLLAQSFSLTFRREHSKTQTGQVNFDHSLTLFGRDFSLQLSLCLLDQPDRQLVLVFLLSLRVENSPLERPPCQQETSPEGEEDVL